MPDQRSLPLLSDSKPNSFRILRTSVGSNGRQRLFLQRFSALFDRRADPDAVADLVAGPGPELFSPFDCHNITINDFLFPFDITDPVTHVALGIRCHPLAGGCSRHRTEGGHGASSRPFAETAADETADDTADNGSPDPRIIFTDFLTRRYRLTDGDDAKDFVERKGDVAC